jgi:eukaryotic-like serine/threonine-protein kinase
MEVNRKKTTKKFLDQRGKEYKATKVLGRGGQGIVYELEGGKYAIKLVKAKDRLAAERLEQRFKAIKTMDLKDLPVAKPLLLLQRPTLGYVMEIATGMIPLKSMLMAPKEANLVEWYIANGGIRRRLSLLIRLAEVLATMHVRGIIYGDLSPQNVFVSEDIAFAEIFLIDLDNLRILTRHDDFIHTPGYGAPELLNRTAGTTSLSDCHSFAVIAFQFLCNAHPLIGDYVNEGDPDLEEQAYKGEIPWVRHSSDPTNALSSGLPMEITSSPRMQKLFSRAFEQGLQEPTLRPGMNEWREVLETASDALVTCPACQSDYFYNPSQSDCRFCDEPQPEAFFAYIKNWEPLSSFYSHSDEANAQLKLFNSKVQTQGGIIIGGARQSSIRKRHIFLTTGDKGRESLVHISISRNKATIQPGELEIWITPDLKKPSQKHNSPLTIPASQLHGLSIHFKPLSEPQRLIHIRKLT